MTKSTCSAWALKKYQAMEKWADGNTSEVGRVEKGRVGLVKTISRSATHVLAVDRSPLSGYRHELEHNRVCFCISNLLSQSNQLSPQLCQSVMTRASLKQSPRQQMESSGGPPSMERLH